MTGYTHEATNLPTEIDSALPEIIENTIQAAFGKIASELESRGYPVTGDFTPDEVEAFQNEFENYVRLMALNNNAIAKLNDF